METLVIAVESVGVDMEVAVEARAVRMERGVSGSFGVAEST